jgi:hypothetical protein
MYDNDAVRRTEEHHDRDTPVSSQNISSRMGLGDCVRAHHYRDVVDEASLVDRGFGCSLIQGIYVFHFVRYPVCRGRLASHRAPVSRTTRYRFQLACPHCRVIWDTGEVRNDDVFFNS